MCRFIDTWYKHALKRVNSDLHIEDYDDLFLSRYDAETYVNSVLASGAQSLWIWMNSHIGYCYFLSKDGYTHKHFQKESIRDFLDLCDKNGMVASAYYSLVYNNIEYEKHPEWRMIDVHGYSSRESSDEKATSF